GFAGHCAALVCCVGAGSSGFCAVWIAGGIVSSFHHEIVQPNGAVLLFRARSGRWIVCVERVVAGSDESGVAGASAVGGGGSAVDGVGDCSGDFLFDLQVETAALHPE